VTGKNG